MTGQHSGPTIQWRIVVSAALLISATGGAQTPARRTLTEDLRIDTKVLAVVGFSGIAELSDGRIILGDADGLLVLSPRGELIRNIGRIAVGTSAIRGWAPIPSANDPPQSDSLLTIGGVERFGVLGDTIWIGDAPFRRLIFVNEFGAVLKVVPGDSSIIMRVFPDPLRRSPPVTIHPPGQWGVPWAVLPGGRTIAPYRVFIDERPAIGVPMRHAMMRGNLNGVAVDTIAVWTTHNNTTSVKGNEQGRGQLMSNELWSRNPVNVSADGRRLAIAEVTSDGPSAGEYQIRVSDENGNIIYQRRYSYTPKPVPPAVAESIVRAKVATRTRFQGNVDSAVRVALNMPSSFPPITRILVGPAGDVWLRGYPETGGTIWTVLNPSGETVATVEEPREMQIFAVGRGVIWGVQYDAEKPMLVVRYRVSNP